MKRLCEARAYGKKPIAACYWASTTDTPELATLTQDISTEIAIIGAGFTGLSAAHHLAKRGADVTVVEAEFPAFGATGRNGGFCCLGGARAENIQLDKRYGKAQRLAYRRSEAAAVGLVKTLLDEFDLQADTHSSGETLLAHRASDCDRLKNSRAQIKEDYGVEALFHSKSELRQLGMQGPFHGALTIPIGFGLNPRKYAYGLLSSAVKNGGKVFANSPVIDLKKIGGTFRLTTPQGSITADRVIIATNAYAAENLPDWMAGRFMPLNSSVIVTDPLTPKQIEAQGWSSAQMAYDTRQLLHYFRLMPNRQFLFGMRGGLFSTDRSEAAIQKLIMRDFHAMFPAWKSVKIQHFWTGMVCMTRHQIPFIGAIPNLSGAYAGFGYHGNGVAMASYAGAVLSDLAIGGAPVFERPKLLETRPPKFPLGRYRRQLLAPAYTLKYLQDL